MLGLLPGCSDVAKSFLRQVGPGGDNGDEVALLDDRDDARLLGCCASVGVDELRAETRRTKQLRVGHPGQAHICDEAGAPCDD
jgi:hypothetical protein